MTAIKREARRAAQRTLDSSWVGEGYPVDPIAIARRLGLEVYKSDLPASVSGMISKAPFEAAEIYLDVDDPRVRQRFTCAHEIGHYIRHVDEDDGEYAFVEVRGPGAARGDDLEEVYANEFAAALLMPEDPVRRSFHSGDRQLEMSQVFGVSVETAKWRLVNLGLTSV